MNDINEVFDSTFEVRKAPIASARRYTEEDSQDPELFFIMQEDQDAIITFVKNGYREIHHLDDEGNSGYIRRDRHNPNLKYISTVMKLVKEYIQRGEKVKILATEELSKKYYKVAVAVWKREKNFILGTIQKSSAGDSRLQFVIHESTTNYGYEKVGSYTLIEKANVLYFNGELQL